MDEEQRKAVDEAQYGSMMAGYEAVLPRFATGRDRPPQGMVSRPD
jgi:hypothetical protein